MKPIISELNIEKYRGINRLKLNDLSRINVLAGVNNSGKTSVLEVIGLLSNPSDTGTMIQWLLKRAPNDAKKRRNNVVDYISAPFKKESNSSIDSILFMSTVNSISSCYLIAGIQSEDITLNGEQKTKYQVTSVFAPAVHDALKKFKVKNLKVFRQVLSEAICKAWNDSIESHSPVLDDDNSDTTRLESFGIKNGSIKAYPPKYTALFQLTSLFTEDNYYENCVKWIQNAIVRENRKQDILNVLAKFDASIDDITIINEDIYLHSELSGTQPLFSYGTGMQKAVLLMSLLIGNENGVIVVDEIDNAINISAFKEVFSWFINACRERNVQAFVTTHSLEAIDAILESTEDDAENGLEDDIRIITLQKTPKTHRSVAMIRTGEEARSDRDRCEMELRV